MEHGERPGAPGHVTASRRDRHHLWSWSGLTLTLSASALWGLAPALTNGALTAFSPELIALTRLGLGALLCRLLAGPGQPWVIRDRWLGLAGVALGADFVLYNYGVQRTTAAVAGLLVNVEMLTTIGLAVWLLGERVTFRRLLGCIITLSGAIYLSLDGAHLDIAITDTRFLGNLLVMAASMCWSVYAIGQRRSQAPADLFARLATIFLVAALTVAPSCLHADVWRMSASGREWAMLLGLTLLCTVAVYWIYARAQQLIDTSVLAILFCTIPMFSVLFARILLGEPITQSVLRGGLLIIAGVTVVATAAVEGERRNRDRRAAAPDSTNIEPLP